MMAQARRLSLVLLLSLSLVTGQSASAGISDLCKLEQLVPVESEDQVQPESFVVEEPGSEPASTPTVASGKPEFQPPSYLSPQTLKSAKEFRQAKKFMTLFYSKKLELLHNNRAGIQSLVSCLQGDNAGCESLKELAIQACHRQGELEGCEELSFERKDLVKTFEETMLRRLRIFRTLQSLVVPPGGRDRASLRWQIDELIDKDLTSRLPHPLVEVQQEPLLDNEFGAARNVYVDLWEKLATDAFEYFTCEHERISYFLEKQKLLRIIGQVQEASRAEKPEDKIRALGRIDYPGWNSILNQEVQEFREKMYESWFEILSGNRLFAFLPQAKPSLDDFATALQYIVDNSSAEQRLIEEEKDKIENSRSTRSEAYSLYEMDGPIIDAVLTEHPQYEDTAMKLLQLTERSEKRFHVALFGGAVLSMFLPITIALPVFVGADALWIYDTRAAYQAEKQSFFAFDSKADSYRDDQLVRDTMEDKFLVQALAPLSFLGAKAFMRSLKGLK